MKVNAALHVCRVLRFRTMSRQEHFLFPFLINYILLKRLQLRLIPRMSELRGATIRDWCIKNIIMFLDMDIFLFCSVNKRFVFHNSNNRPRVRRISLYHITT